MHLDLHYLVRSARAELFAHTPVTDDTPVCPVCIRDGGNLYQEVFATFEDPAPACPDCVALRVEMARTPSRRLTWRDRIDRPAYPATTAAEHERRLAEADALASLFN
jgi:hypothetical protein